MFVRLNCIIPRVSVFYCNIIFSLQKKDGSEGSKPRRGVGAGGGGGLLPPPPGGSRLPPPPSPQHAPTPAAAAPAPASSEWGDFNSAR